MSDGTTYSAPGLKVVSLGSRGRGVVAERNFKQGEVIAIWRGSIITESQAVALSDSERSQLLQVAEDAFLITHHALVNADFINHSCEPNCGFTDSTTLVAMRDINAGETVTFDYAMSDTKPIFTFDCWCGTSKCRKKIIGNDWQLADLQERYAGWFAPHVARLIKQSQH
ncbi:MAG: SET domain-containing protein [Acidimicrobiaceae bacterium]